MKSQILDAWQSCICEDYCLQRINSERSLQASLWSRLNAEFKPPHPRRMFIEPRMSAQVGGSQNIYIPDIVICNSREIIGVIELKYLPRGRPRYEKDINNLADIAKYKQKITVSNERFRGPAVDAREYTLAESVLFVWAGVHAKSKSPEDKSDLSLAVNRNELRGCFLEVHAETNNNWIPTIYWRLLSDKGDSPSHEMQCAKGQ